MTKIKEYLDQCSVAYYNGNPIISDEQFDRLAETSGYMTVGAKQHENICKHYNQMYSLQKYYQDEGDTPLAGIKDLAMTPKLDGAAISILYVNGELTQVLTRGNGIEGTNITDKFLYRKDLIPHKIKHLGIIQIIGEIVAPVHVLNSRNYAAGSLNLKDPKEFSTRSVQFFAYGVYPYITDTFSEDMRKLEKMGFDTVYKRDLYNLYPCDGIVFRVNNNKLFQEMGYTAKHPRAAYAKKDRQEAVETELLAVEWQVGKSGKVTPVAILKPVMIGDALVSRATLNNPGFIEQLGLCIGDTVALVRSGEVIPCITHKVDA